MPALFSRRPWLLVVLAFAILLAAWTTLILVAVKNRPEKVPLEHLGQDQAPETGHR